MVDVHTINLLVAPPISFPPFPNFSPAAPRAQIVISLKDLDSQKPIDKWYKLLNASGQEDPTVKGARVAVGRLVRAVAWVPLL